MRVPSWFKQDVSRETLDDLTHFSDFLSQWSPKINLVSSNDLKVLESRHIWDSAQVYLLGHGGTKWLDIGSGGGLPAIVCSIFLKHSGAKHSVCLIESDQRKCAFLRTVVRELELNAKVHSKRVEDVPTTAADVITARALASLDQLLVWTERFTHNRTQFIFPKGASWQSEVDKSRSTWHFDLQVHPSQTHPAAAILELTNVRRK